MGKYLVLFVVVVVVVAVVVVVVVEGVEMEPDNDCLSNIVQQFFHILQEHDNQLSCSSKVRRIS